MTTRPRRARPTTEASAPQASQGGAAGALSRRVRRPKDGSPIEKSAPVVLEYQGTEEAPMLLLLKGSPVTRQSHRKGSNLHVSDLIGKCVRRIALIEHLAIPHPAERLPDGQGITYAIGDALHEYVTSRFTSGSPGRVYASWGCACDATRKIGTFSEAQRQGTCPECNTALSKHHEIPFIHPDYPLTGSPDVVLRMPEYGGAFFITELKSMAAAQWKELVRPLPEHAVQVSFYWNILHALGLPLVDKVSIVYVNKEYSFKLPYKEFLVDPRKPGRLDPYMEELSAFTAFRAGGPLPPRTMCASLDTTTAKSCPVCVSCFGCP